MEYRNLNMELGRRTLHKGKPSATQISVSFDRES